MSAAEKHDALQPLVGLIAGNGSFPMECARQAAAKGISVIVVAHTGETNPEIEKLASRCVWVKVGELGKVIDTFISAGVRQVAFAGGISRIKLFGGVKLDLRALALVSKIGSIKDDAILRGVAGELERSGLTVISASRLLENATLGPGCLTKRNLNEDERADARIGWHAARAIAPADIGQTVIAAQGLIVAVEAVEGTDAAIRRAGQLAGAGSVVVKLCKPQQDVRIDLPTVGPETIAVMREAGARALILEANRCVILDPDAFIRSADKAEIAVVLAGNADDL